MTFDPVRQLAEAGIDLRGVSDDQRAVIAGLTPEEVAMLISVHGRLNEQDPEVEAHIIGGLLF
jgi:hypothetical protein